MPRPARKLAKPRPRRHRTPSSRPAAQPIAKEPVAAVSFGRYEPRESSSSATTIVFATLLGFAFVLLVAAWVSPAYVPWPRVAAGLHANRSELAMLGFGAAAIALVALSLQRFGV